MAKPSDVLRDHLDCQLALVHAFVGHNVREDILAVTASHNDAFHELALLAGFQ